MALYAIGMLAGCSTSASTPDRVTQVRQSLQAAGLKDISVSDDHDKGVMTLSGNVSTDGQKGQADSIARSMMGPEVLSNQILVVPPGFEKRAKVINADLDKGINANLDAALIHDDLHKGVKFAVKNGVVTLTGTVPSERLRTQVQALARGVPNVQEVVNELQVKDQKASASN
jgi:hyperosmotically inducible protein